MVVAHFVARLKNLLGQTKKFFHVRVSALVLQIKVGIQGNEEAPSPWSRCSEESRVTGANIV